MTRNSAIRNNIVLVRYSHSARTKQYTKKRKTTTTQKAGISTKTISLDGSANRLAFSIS